MTLATAASLPDHFSRKFRFWSFTSMLLLVVVHGYNLEVRYLQPWTIPGEPMTFTAFFEYLFANALLRFRIPMLFIISGYLFAMHDDVPYGKRILKRTRTLLLPYVLWSAVSLLFVMMLEFTATGRELLVNTRFMQADEHRFFLSQYTIGETIGRWLFGPPAYQLWFIRSLFMYNVLAPLLTIAVLHRIGRWFFFVFAGLFWLTPIHIFFIEGEGLLFFSLGLLMRKQNFDLDGAPPVMSTGVWGMVFGAAGIAKTVLAFTGPALLGMATEPVLLLLHKITVASGLVFMWSASSGIARWCMEQHWFVRSSAFSFFLYAMHAPFIVFAIEMMFRLFGHPWWLRSVGFVALPAMIVLFCIGTGALVRRISPTAYGWLTGGRGMGM